MQAGNLNDAGSALAMELLPGKPDACRELLWWLVRGLGELRCLWPGCWRVQSLAVLGSRSVGWKALPHRVCHIVAARLTHHV